MAPPRKTAATKPPKPASIRDRLAKKRAKTEIVYFPIDDEGEKAIETLTKRQQLLELAETQHARQGEKSEIDLEGIRRLVAEAEKQRDEHTMSLQIRGLSEDSYDALASEYQDFDDIDELPDDATDEQRKQQKAAEMANLKKLQDWTYHALEETVVGSDLTADEWREELSSDRWTAGDTVKLRNAIRTAYGAQPADGIPKD